MNGLEIVPKNFAVLEKLGFCSKCSQNFSGFSFARACIFLFLVFSGGYFLKSARCSQASERSLAF